MCQQNFDNPTFNIFFNNINNIRSKSDFFQKIKVKLIINVKIIQIVLISFYLGF